MFCVVQVFVRVVLCALIGYICPLSTKENATVYSTKQEICGEICAPVTAGVAHVLRRACVSLAIGVHRITTPGALQLVAVWSFFFVPLHVGWRPRERR